MPMASNTANDTNDLPSRLQALQVRADTIEAALHRFTVANSTKTDATRAVLSAAEYDLRHGSKHVRRSSWLSSLLLQILAPEGTEAAVLECLSHGHARSLANATMPRLRGAVAAMRSAARLQSAEDGHSRNTEVLRTLSETTADAENGFGCSAIELQLHEEVESLERQIHTVRSGREELEQRFQSLFETRATLLAAEVARLRDMRKIRDAALHTKVLQALDSPCKGVVSSVPTTDATSVGLPSPTVMHAAGVLALPSQRLDDGGSARRSTSTLRSLLSAQS